MNFYRFYLIVYLLLFTSYLTFSQIKKRNTIKTRHLLYPIKTAIYSKSICCPNKLVGLLPGRITNIADKDNLEFIPLAIYLILIFLFEVI